MAFYDKYVAEREMAKSGVAWFKFDEASGNVTDSKGTAVGTVTGATRIAGVSGNALSFTAGSSHNVQFSTKVIPLGKRVVRIRFKRNGNPTTNEYIYSNCIGSAYHGDNVYINSSGQLVWISNKGTSGTPRFTLTTTISICDNQWHDILLVWDGTTNSNAVKIYVDNMNTSNIEGTALSTETTIQQYNLTIGRTYTSTTPTYSNYLTGAIDEFEVYSDIINPFSYKTLVLHEGSYKHLDVTTFKTWQTKTTNAPTLIDYQQSNIAIISKLDRSITSIPDIAMIDNTSVLLPNGDIGKIFSKTIDLNKYFDIRKIEVK